MQFYANPPDKGFHPTQNDDFKNELEKKLKEKSQQTGQPNKNVPHPTSLSTPGNTSATVPTPHSYFPGTKPKAPPPPDPSKKPGKIIEEDKPEDEPAALSPPLNSVTNKYSNPYEELFNKLNEYYNEFEKYQREYLLADRSIVHEADRPIYNEITTSMKQIHISFTPIYKQILECRTMLFEGTTQEDVFDKFIQIFNSDEFDNLLKDIAKLNDIGQVANLFISLKSDYDADKNPIVTQISKFSKQSTKSGSEFLFLMTYIVKLPLIFKEIRKGTDFPGSPCYLKATKIIEILEKKNTEILNKKVESLVTVFHGFLNRLLNNEFYIEPENLEFYKKNITNLMAPLQNKIRDVKDLNQVMELLKSLKSAKLRLLTFISDDDYQGLKKVLHEKEAQLNIGEAKLAAKVARLQKQIGSKP